MATSIAKGGSIANAAPSVVLRDISVFSVYFVFNFSKLVHATGVPGRMVIQCRAGGKTDVAYLYVAHLSRARGFRAPAANS
jgi:hypothetical protein